MYGGILVDPETPLPAVDHEWYIVQSEFYTTSTEPGVVDFDRQALTDENPTYVVFNGAKGAVAGDNALQMAVGERARIYFIDAGPDLDSNFHPIGSHWDAVYPEAALLNQPLRGSQTTLVPAGGGVVVDIIGQVPATIILVDHAISRAFDKGAIEVINPTPSGEQSQPSSDQTAVPGASVSILPNAFQAQPMDATDEFADLENPADYSINTLTVSAGTTVTWTNDDPGMLHTITAVDGSFDSGFLNDGDTWSYTFAEPGEFEYFCTPHPWMRAKVIVEG
jgi:nitrite reductase (NO-forming)